MNGYNSPPQNRNDRTYNSGTPAQRKAPQTPPKRRKKKIYFRPNKEGMTALITLVLIVAIIITLLVLMIKGIVNAVSGPEETTTEATTTAETTTAAPVTTWHDDFLTQMVSTSGVAEGDLILVNFQHSYPNTDAISKDLKSLYGTDGHNDIFVLNNSSVKIRREIVAPLKNMLTALVEANPETLTDETVIIVSGHRTIEYQTDLYNDVVGTEDEGLRAVPGHSEHHTGYAVDLKIFNENNMTILMRDNEQEWMEAHCAEYGFVLRYDGTKAEITGILDETWHYRYVGIPHATYMMQNDLCLEEYLDLIRISHNLESDEPLTFTAGEDDYMVYYVPASADSTTEVPVPPTADGEWEISGDNMNGFIVTVKLAKSASAE